MNSRLKEVAAVLVADDPRIQATRLLQTLVKQVSASGAAILVPGEADRLSLFAAIGDAGSDVERLARIGAAWRTQRAAFEGNEPRWRDEGDVVLTLSVGGPIVGLLYLIGPDRASVRADELDVYRMVLASAVLAPGRPTVEAAVNTLLATSHEEDMRRRQLVGALNAHEWNISRVARLLGVTRRTIYLRLQRYNITRQKVPKRILRRASA